MIDRVRRLKVCIATTRGEHCERPGGGDEFGDGHLLAGGVGVADVAGSVVKGGDPTGACIEPQVAAVRSSTKGGVPPLGVMDRAEDLVHQRVRGVDVPA